MKPVSLFILILALSSTTYAQTGMADLTAEQQNRVKKILAERSCTCGCDMTIATCLVEDPSCETAPKLAQQIIAEVAAEQQPPGLERLDLAKLTKIQKARVVEILTQKNCTCGCDMTVATCLAEDPTCETAPKLARQVIAETVKKFPKIDLKRVDLSPLSAQQQIAAYKSLSTNTCTCGCGMTIAKCLVDDPSCETSPRLAREIIARLAATAPPAKQTARPAIQSDQGKWYREVVGRKLLYIYVGNGYRKKEQIWLCSDGSFQSSGYGGSLSSLGSAAFSDGVGRGKWAVNGDVLSLVFSNGSVAKYKLSFYDGYLYLDNTRYFRTENDLCK